MHCNGQGLLGHCRKTMTGGTHLKMDKLRSLLLSTRHPPIFCITKIKLSSDVDDSDLSIPGFALFRSDRNRHGGGVAIYCCESLRPKRILYESIKGVEYTCIKVSTTNMKYLSVCCIYRPPTSTASWKGAFFALTDSIRSTSTPYIITGDFNIDLISNSQFAEDLSSTFDLMQHITNATKTTTTSGTFIDHIYSHGINNIDTYVCEQHIADHSLDGCAIQLSKLQIPNIQLHMLNTFKSLKNLDHTTFCTDLSAIPWVNILNKSPNVNAMVPN